MTGIYVVLHSRRNEFFPDREKCGVSITFATKRERKLEFFDSRKKAQDVRWAGGAGRSEEEVSCL